MDQQAIPKLKTGFARQRRAAASRCERALWHELRAKRLDGWKFRREAPVGPYVVDFVCFEARLVIEADGSLHGDVYQRQRDQRREISLEGAGFQVLRFSEEEILSDLGQVLDRIHRALPQSPPSPGSLRDPPSPSPKSGVPDLGGQGWPNRETSRFGQGEGTRITASSQAEQITGSSHAGKVLIIACGALAREIGAIVEANGLDHIELTCLPAIWHNRPERIAPGVRELIRENRGRYRRIAVAYAECGTQGELDKVCAEEGVERIAGPHCYSFYWGNEAFAVRGDDDIDAFFLTDFLARQFESFVIEPLGLDRHPELRDMYFGNYRRLIYLAQSDDAELEAKARLAAERLDLTYERRRTGYGDLATFVAGAAGGGHNHQ
jgi:very-short-patch-repair endonuclease